MFSFITNPLTLRLHQKSSFCHPLTRPRNYQSPTRRRFSLPLATYTADLQTRTTDIDPNTTDELLSSLHPNLQSDPSLIPLSTLEQMVIHLADPRGMSRLSLVEAFGVIGSRALPLLLQGLSECPNPVVRRSCGKALAKIADSRATHPLLNTLLNDPDTVTRSSAAGALARMGEPAIEPLIQLLSDSNVSMTAKGHAAWAMAFMQGDAAQALLKSLQHPVVDVRVAVVSALGSVALGDALPSVNSYADGDEWNDEDEGYQELKELAIKAIEQALNDSAPQVKAEAATALANCHCTNQAPVIAEFLKDQDMELRRSAALALLKMGDVAYIPVLQERVDDDTEEDSVRSVARLAVTALERLVDEDDWD